MDNPSDTTTPSRPPTDSEVEARRLIFYMRPGYCDSVCPGTWDRRGKTAIWRVCVHEATCAEATEWLKAYDAALGEARGTASAPALRDTTGEPEPELRKLANQEPPANEPAETARAVEAAARALWKIGNERIGYRQWDSVREHYLREAKAALDAAALKRDELDASASKPLKQCWMDGGPPGCTLPAEHDGLHHSEPDKTQNSEQGALRASLDEQRAKVAALEGQLSGAKDELLHASVALNVCQGWLKGLGAGTESAQANSWRGRAFEAAHSLAADRKGAAAPPAPDLLRENARLREEVAENEERLVTANNAIEDAAALQDELTRARAAYLENAELLARAQGRVGVLEHALRKHGCHTRDCEAYRSIGRFGSASGLFWNEAEDEARCTCTLGAALAPPPTAAPAKEGT